MQQQQPGTVTHSRISSLLISRRLTRPRVASRYSVRTFMWPEVGVVTQIFGCASHASGWTPLSKFLNLPLSRIPPAHSLRAKRASKVFIHALFPLQPRMAIYYRYESAYFPAPYADNQLPLRPESEFLSGGVVWWTSTFRNRSFTFLRWPRSATSDIRHPSSVIRHPSSVIRHPSSRF